MNADSMPLGVFDSGVGGLSILKEIGRLLPAEDALYYSDNAYCPYGIKPRVDVMRRVFDVADTLVEMGTKLLVVACNTASIVALDALRQRYSLPIVGIEPGVKPATSATRNGRIGVLATSVSLSGDRFAHLVERFASGFEVFTQPAPGLVELVEAGKIEGPEVEGLLHCYLDPLIMRGIDTVVLGCTHYPFLKPAIAKLLGAEVVIIDTGEAVARQTARIIEEHSLWTSDSAAGRYRFMTSGHVDSVQPVIQRLWGDSAVTVEYLEV